MRNKMVITSLLSVQWLFAATGVSAQSLTEVVQETLATNPDVQIAISQRNAVEQEMKQAKAGFFPSADINVGHGWETSNNPTTRGRGDGTSNLDRSEAEITIRQLLFDGSATESEVERQRARVNSRAYTTFGTSEVIALKAIEAYLDVLRQQKLVAFAQENLAAHQKTHDQITKRSERGVGRRSDAQQTLGRLALARTNLMAEENNLRDAIFNFERIVGKKPEGLSEPASIENLIPASLDDAIAMALANHPTLMSAEADVEAARMQQKAAKALFYPRFHLEVSGSENDDLDGIPGPNRDGQIMVRGRYNLKGGRDMARREETAYLLNEAVEVKNNTRRQVIESIQLSWHAYQTAKQQLENFRIHVDASQQARDAYKKQFNIGQRTLLDLLDSENELFTARIDYANSINSLSFATYRILAGTGQLLQTMEVTPPQEIATVSKDQPVYKLPALYDVLK
jgi:adhesin transport system outer membrane protein